MQLFIGTPAWSSWSMRPWLALRRAGADFDLTTIRLRQADATREAIRQVSPSGKIPALRDGDLLVWDSLAICEYVAERFPATSLWPSDPATRALARASASEMHSGFVSLRNECPMALEADPRDLDLSDGVQADVRRIVSHWTQMRRRFSGAGPFLFGDWSIADAFWTPVSTRLRTYRVDLSVFRDEGEAQAYADTLLSAEEFLEWEAMARSDPTLS